MVFSILWLRIVMNKKMSPGGEFAYWMTTWMMAVFNFAVAFNEIREYVYLDKNFTKYRLRIPSDGTFLTI